MSAALRKARQQARATGRAMLGGCILAEMSGRYQTPKRDGVRVLASIRLREIEKVIRHRHGNIIEDASDTDDVDVFRGYVIAVGGSLSEVRGWARRWMPWFDDEATFVEAQDLGGKLASNKTGARILPADAVAKLMLISLRERTALGLTTIGACDVDKPTRAKAAKERKRERDRERQRARRKAEGRTPRAEYVASSEASIRPWETAGISRATWYRRQKLDIETSPSRAIFITKGGDTPVSRERNIAPLSSIDILSPKGERMGLGDQSPTEIHEAEPHGAIYIRDARYG